MTDAGVPYTAAPTSPLRGASPPRGLQRPSPDVTGLGARHAPPSARTAADRRTTLGGLGARSRTFT